MGYDTHGNDHTAKRRARLERHAERLLREVMHRTRWTVATRDGVVELLEAVIADERRNGTWSLNDQIAVARARGDT